MARAQRILFVDDEADFLASVTFWLTSKGHDVTTASSGKQAIELIQQQPPDIVFLDVHMPEMDGLETLRRIRAFNRKIPVVIVTVDDEQEEKLAGEKGLGISGFFMKQRSLEDLGWVLECALRIHGKSDAPSEPGTP
jgi:CheY-like chemotaxis protein